jgi:UDP-N-acetyl-D-mannosaminuronate dehydrogenase
VYPHFYLQGDAKASIVSAARLANKSVPLRMIDVVRVHFGNLMDKRIAILGLAYRSGVKEHAFSGAKDLVQEAKALGAKAVIHDPMYSDAEIEELGFEPYHLGDACDAVILHTNHEAYKSIKSTDFPEAEIFVDGRNSSPQAIRDTMKTFVIGKGF